MTSDLDKAKEFIRRCKKSVTYFINTCCKIKHPSIGIIPFKTFSYQNRCLESFRQHRFNIFRKCRQSGISTLTGAYALWFAMFHSNKTVLIVSKRDEDAKEYLARNVKFIYHNLPEWVQKIWVATSENEHEIAFSNGSKIKSLTASPNTLRSASASLNIIDEAAFIPDMESMWAGGFSTLQHGGSVIVISTPNGVGNWYWGTWTGALDNLNDFNPIEIMWWDMDWVLEWMDPLSHQPRRIAPRDGIRECTGKEDIEKYGPYWSQWLEGEYRGLQQKGEGHLFKQEVLAEFMGSGGTILGAAVLQRVGRIIKQYTPSVLKDMIDYIHPITGEKESLDFNGAEANEGLWIWNEPINPIPEIRRGNRIVVAGIPGHRYAMGVDVATGKNNDYSTIEVFDIDTLEQVAEFMAKVSVTRFAKMVDYVGRLYNNALACVERTGLGNDLVDDLQNLMYPNLWRKKRITPQGIQYGPPGFATTDVSKPTLNKALQEGIIDDEQGGYTIKSIRLWRQLQIFIRHRNKHGFDTGKVGAQTGKGNHDDLVISTALAFISIPDATETDPAALIPTRSGRIATPELVVGGNRAAMQAELVKTNDPNILMPYGHLSPPPLQMTIDAELEKFGNELAAGPIREIPVISIRRHDLKKRII